MALQIGLLVNLRGTCDVACRLLHRPWLKMTVDTLLVLRLERIDLSFNRLTGAVPSEFGMLTSISE